MKLWLRHIVCILTGLSIQSVAMSQISPGELSKAHEAIEGIHHCENCHVLGGEKGAANFKCLECHKEIGQLISSRKGYHASVEVNSKKCASCHSEHHGKGFNIVPFDPKKFNHQLTSFDLKGKHAALTCESCHASRLITKGVSQKTRGLSYLGLGTECLTCHDDYHQKTLSGDCRSCHGFDSFKPAPGFNHQTTKYPLTGAHQKVDCAECHVTVVEKGKKFQQFTGIRYANCTDCHEDVHQGKFGTDCLKCHTIQTFKTAEKSSAFDHDKTGYPLEGKHKTVDCKACHQRDFISPLPHGQCSDCHEDYHKGQFRSTAEQKDCDRCHTLEDFSPSTFSIEEHNRSQFVLAGGHLATPCLACHKKGEQWEFRKIGKRCIDCHEDVHKGFIEGKYYPNQTCEKCHNEVSWNQIKFDHRLTSFELSGVHSKQSCRECHYVTEKNGIVSQRFSSLDGQCETCHSDVHLGQFKVGGQNDCLRCHGFNDWKAEKFDHDQTPFKLEGGHKGLVCNDCHKEVQYENGKGIKYKFEEVKCSDCHTSRE